MRPCDPDVIRHEEKPMRMDLAAWISCRPPMNRQTASLLPTRFRASYWTGSGGCAPSWPSETSPPRCCSTRPMCVMPPARATCRSTARATLRAMPSCPPRGRWCCSSFPAANTWPVTYPRWTRYDRPRRFPTTSTRRTPGRSRAPGPTRSAHRCAGAVAASASPSRVPPGGGLRVAAARLSRAGRPGAP